MRVTSYLLAAVLVAGLATPLLAQSDPIAQRKAIMEQNGKDTKMLGGMAQGAVPFDAAAAAAAFGRMQDGAAKFGGLFPATSKTGGKTEAAPAIWDKPADFKAATAKFQKDTAAAAAAKPATLDAFRPVFMSVVGNCKSCHESFRVKTQ